MVKRQQNPDDNTQVVFKIASGEVYSGIYVDHRFFQIYFLPDGTAACACHYDVVKWVLASTAFDNFFKNNTDGK